MTHPDTAADNTLYRMKVAHLTLRRLRLEAFLSVSELASKAKLDRMTVQRLEHGGNARMTTIRQLARALEVDPRLLIDIDAELNGASSDDSGAA